MIDKEDIIILIAGGALGYGIWQIHPPSAFIVLGALTLGALLVAQLKRR